MARKNPQRRSAATENGKTESSSADDDVVNLETPASLPLGAGDVRSVAEAPPPAPPPASQLLTYKVIARDGLNLRAGPGTEFPIRRNLPFGTLVGLLKRDGPWALVDTIGDGGADGFAFAAFLEEQPAAPQIVALPAAPDFIELDASLLQIIMDRCAGTRIRSQLDLNVVAKALDDAMIAAMQIQDCARSPSCLRPLLRPIILGRSKSMERVAASHIFPITAGACTS